MIIVLQKIKANESKFNQCSTDFDIQYRMDSHNSILRL